jgi:hypothetical protein
MIYLKPARSGTFPWKQPKHPVAAEQKSIHRRHQARADRATSLRDEQITVSERIDPIAFHIDRPHYRFGDLSPASIRMMFRRVVEIV